MSLDQLARGLYKGKGSFRYLPNNENQDPNFWKPLEGSDAPAYLTVTSTQLSLDPPGSLLPPDVNLTTEGIRDWLKTSRDTVQGYDNKKDANVILNPQDVNSPSWSRGSTGVNNQTTLHSWNDGEQLLSYAGDRSNDYSGVINAGKRFILELQGEDSLVRFWQATNNCVGRVIVRLSDDSATMVTLNTPQTGNVFEGRRFDISVKSTSKTAQLIVDYIMVSGAGVIGWQALSVSPLYSPLLILLPPVPAVSDLTRRW